MKNIFLSLLKLEFIPCHRRPERSLILIGNQFPICYRCMMMYIGYFLVPIFLLFEIHISLWIGIIFNIPMLVDGITQKKNWRTSNNFLRFTTGLLSGIGQSIIIVSSSYILIDFILKIN